MKACAQCLFSALCLSGKGHGRVGLWWDGALNKWHGQVVTRGGPPHYNGVVNTGDLPLGCPRTEYAKGIRKEKE